MASPMADTGDDEADLSEAFKKQLNGILVSPYPLRCHRYHKRGAGPVPYALQAFVDDTTGDSPGDDEVVRVDLGCLEDRPFFTDVYRFSPIFRTSLGDFTPGELDSRRL